MKISYEWISQYIDGLTASPEEVAERLTMATAETEGVEELVRSVKGVVVGEIVEISDIPDHPNVKAVKVDCGERQYATVCGAPNVRLGLKVAFAPAGVKIASGVTIQSAEMSGRPSEGIICSAYELGFSQFHENALEVPASVAIGTALSALVPERDWIIEIDNKSLTHRPDLWGHYGVAREVAAVFGLRLKDLPQMDMAQFDGLAAYPLAIDDEENCPCYACIDMRNVRIEPSPLEIQWRLHAVGQRTMDILVDLTNYIMFEIGQPMHAFDGDRLQAVRVAQMGREAEFTTLDNAQRRMLPGDLMIWNEREPVALAGVMGGLNSEVTPQTQRLLLESANFKGARIRRTAMRLNLRSEASQRFEKNQPPRNTQIGIARFLELLKKAGNEPEVLSRLTVAGNLKDEIRYIELSEDFFIKRIGKAIPRERVKEILNSLGFDLEYRGDRMIVGIPPFRSANDISIPEDIVEEVARIYGFGNIEPVLPEIHMPMAQFNDRLRTEHKARRLLAQAHRFSEVNLYSWFDDNWLKTIGWEPANALVLRNPAAEQNRRMRTTLMPNLLAAVSQNQLHHEEFRIFEFGDVYEPLGDNDRVETMRLAAASYRQARVSDLESHFAEVKGALEDLAEMCGGAMFVFRPEDDESPESWKIPGALVNIECMGQSVGCMGYLDGPLLEQVAPKGEVVWFEIEFDKISGPIFPDVQYDPPSPFPGSWFDISVVWETREGYASLLKKLDKFVDPLITERQFLGLYKGKGMDEGQGSYSFRYRLGSKERTLAGEEIEDLQKRFFAFLKEQRIDLR